MATQPTTFSQRLMKAIAAVGFGVRPAATTDDASVPKITAGSGAASASDPNGSLRLRTDGRPEYRLGTAWAVVRTFGAITDPGNAGAIPVTTSGYCPIVTAGAETRTLAAPSFIGQELLLYMKTDGGDCVVTCATTFNEAGNNTATFGDTGDSLRLIAVEEGANLRWRCAVADGHTLTTV